VRSPDGTLLYARPSGVPADVPVRRLSGPYTVDGLPVVIQVARSEEPIRRELGELLMILGAGLPLAVAIAGMGGYFLARRALAPVSRMLERARTITAERLGERLPVENPGDELGQLAAVFNDAFARLERSFEQLRRFTADASHELRTPLTAMRSVGEVGLRERRDAAAYREIIGSMLEETDRLGRVVEGLLTLSRADGGEVSASSFGTAGPGRPLRSSTPGPAYRRSIATACSIASTESTRRDRVTSVALALACLSRVGQSRRTAGGSIWTAQRGADRRSGS